MIKCLKISKLIVRKLKSHLFEFFKFRICILKRFELNLLRSLKKLDLIKTYCLKLKD